MSEAQRHRIQNKQSKAMGNFSPSPHPREKGAEANHIVIKIVPTTHNARRLNLSTNTPRGERGERRGKRQRDEHRCQFAVMNEKKSRHSSTRTFFGFTANPNKLTAQSMVMFRRTPPQHRLPVESERMQASTALADPKPTQPDQLAP